LLLKKEFFSLKCLGECRNVTFMYDIAVV